MRLLLDTHAFLWFLLDDPRLSATAQAFMEREIADNDFRILPIEPKHTALLTTMSLHHKDPFDRLLVAQAMAEGIPLVSADPRLDAYGITRIW